MSETGTATLGMSVERQSRRKRKTTRITSTIEMSSVICTSWTEARIVRVASIATDEVDHRRDLGLEAGQQRRDAVDGLDDVGARAAGR